MKLANKEIERWQEAWTK